MASGKHSYATDFSNKPKLFVSLFIVSGLVAAALSPMFSWLGQIFSIALPPFSALTLFGGFYWLLDRYGWRWRLVRRLLLVPDLNGTWNVVGETRKKDQHPPVPPVKSEWEGTVTVEQTWTKIIIRQRVSMSSSRSTCASIVELGNDAYELTYLYENVPEKDSDQDMERHRGAAVLRINTEKQIVDGDYFTDQSRSTEGKMRWSRTATTKAG